MTDPLRAPPKDAGPAPRPEDVDTGFWLWLVALPLMVIGYVVDVMTMPVDGPTGYVYAVSGVLVVVVASIVATFLLLMREGYRWARTILTGGGSTTIVYAATNLFGVDRPPVAAVVYAVTAIVGSVAIAGGIFLLHRKQTHAFFSR